MKHSGKHLALLLVSALLLSLLTFPAAAAGSGDANGSGVVDADDAVLVLRYSLGVIGEDGLDMTAADINGDGSVDDTDSRDILLDDIGRVGGELTPTPGAGSAAISCGSASGAVGDSVTVSVEIANNPGFAAAKFSLSYDKNALKLTKIKDAFISGAHNLELGTANHASDGNLTDNGVLFTASFEILETAEAGKSYGISVGCMKFNDVNASPVPFTVSSGSVSVKAAPAPAQIICAGISCRKGETVSLPVSIVGNPGFASARFTVSYDKSALELVSIEKDIMKGAISSVEQGSISSASSSNVTEDGTLFTLTFKVLDAAETGKKYPVAISCGKLSNEDLEEVPYTITNGSVLADEDPGEPEPAVLASGSCGDGLEWKLDSSGTLTISGSGTLEEFTAENPAPWQAYAGRILTISVGEGVTGITPGSFSGCSGVTRVALPLSVNAIPEDSFRALGNLEKLDYAGTAFRWSKLAGHEGIDLSLVSFGGEVIDGDLNCDDVIDSDDAMLALRYDVKKISEDKVDFPAGDVNGDGVVDSDDAMLMLRYDVKKISSFPVNRK